MKHLILPAIAATLLLASCHNDSKLKEAIEQSKTELPKEIVPQFTMQSLSDDGQYVTYRYLYADSLYNPKRDIENTTPEVVKGTTLRTLRDNKPSDEFFDAVAEAGRGFRFVYVGVPSGDSCSLEITPEEVTAIANEK